MSAAQTDEEKYNLLWGWLAERFDQLLEGAGEVVKALELTKIITNFSALRKNDKSFWNNAGGLKRQYLKSGEIAGWKWEEIKWIILPAAVEVLREVGNGQNYVYHLRRGLCKANIEHIDAPFHRGT